MKKQEKIDIHGWGITVDEEIATTLSTLSNLQRLIINYGYHSYNKNILTPRAAPLLPHTVMFHASSTDSLSE